MATALAQQREAACDYYKRLFPKQDVWEFYMPRWTPRADCREEHLIAAVGKVVPPHYRIYTFGSQERSDCPTTADHLRALIVANANNKTRDLFRYDAGPVLNVPPREFLANRRMQVFDATHKVKLNEKSVAYSEFRIDIDATELKEVREYCGCGSAKEKLCKRCAIAVGALAKYYEIKLKANFNIPITSWHSSGARGLHGFSQYLAPSQPFYERRQQIVNDMIDTATTPPEALSILQAAEGSLQGTKIRVTMDSGVTVNPSHYTRGLFSIHDTTQRICVPIDADPQTFHVDSSPLLSDVRANPEGHVEWQMCLQRVRSLNARKMMMG